MSEATSGEYDEQYPYQSNVLEILESVGAFRDGHFVYTSGLHGEKYILKDALYVDPEKTALVCSYLVAEFVEDGIEVVIGPAMGGIILSQYTALHLSQSLQTPIYSVFAEKVGPNKELALTRGYDQHISGRRILVVEDNLTTVGSVSKVVDLVRSAGGYVVCVGAICNRGGVQITDIGNPDKFISLANIPMESWTPDDCPLCRSGRPITSHK